MTFAEIDRFGCDRLNAEIHALIGALPDSTLPLADYTKDYALLPKLIAKGQALGYRWHFSDEPHGEQRKTRVYWEGHLTLCVGVQMTQIRNRADELPELACRLLLKASSLAK